MERVQDCLRERLGSLLFASGSGNKKAVEHWLGQGADIMVKNTWGKTVLHKAAAGGHLELVRFLLEKKADIDAKDYRKRTVLHYAVESGSMPLVKYLLEEVLNNGEYINIADSEGQTSLDVAAGHGDLEMTKYLLGKRPKLSDKGEPNFSPLRAAAAANHPKLVEYFLGQETNVEVRNQGKNLALRAAIQGEHLELVRLLLKGGARADSEMMRSLTERIASLEESPEDGYKAIRLKSSIAVFTLVTDFSVNPVAAKRIRQAVSSLIPVSELLSDRAGLPTVLRSMVFDYVGADFLSEFSVTHVPLPTKQQKAEQKIEQEMEQKPSANESPVTIKLVEEALRRCAKEIDNPKVADTYEGRLEKIEAIRQEVIANLKDVQSIAECNFYWKQLKRVFKETVSKASFQAASSNFERSEILDAAFAAIPVPSTTYVPPPSLAPLVSVAAQPVDASKRERKESKEEELESAPLTTSTQSAVQIDAPMPAVQTTSSSSSSSSSQQPPLSLAGFSRAQIQAAIDASLKEQERGYKPDAKGRDKQEWKKGGSSSSVSTCRKRKESREEECEQPVKDLGTKPTPEKKGRNVATAAAGKRSQDSAGPAQWESDAVGVSTKEEEPEQRSAKGYALGVSHFGGTGQGKSKAEKRGREPSNRLGGPTKMENSLSSGSGETAEREPVPKKPKDENSGGPSKR